MSTDFSTYSRGVANVTRWCLDHTKTAVGVATALLLISVFFISRIQVDSSPETYMEGAPAWNEYEQINRSFGVGETIVIAVRESGGTIFDADSVRTIAQIDEKVSEFDAVKRVLSIASASVIEMWVRPKRQTRSTLEDYCRVDLSLHKAHACSANVL